MHDEFGAILRAGILPIIGTAPCSTQGFKTWILRGSYSPSITEERTLCLSRVRVDDFSHAISFDYERFALSAHESYFAAMAGRRQFRSLSWPLLKHYYSAFFSAHAIMRSRGAGVVKLNKEQAKFISDSLKAFDLSASGIKSGIYYFTSRKTVNDGIGETTISLSPAKDGNGVHDSFWLLFSRYIESEAERAVEESQADNAEFLQYAQVLKEALGTAGQGTSWISTVRNEINYQHKYETWMPYKKGSRASIGMSEIGCLISSPIRLDRSKEKDPIGAFLSTSCFLSKLNIAVAESIAARSKKGGTFGQKWARMCTMLET